ncbi:MAG TPA: hypothetical protein VGC54_05935 [Planctomycetota bacterium]
MTDDRHPSAPPSFHDALGTQLERAPYLIASLGMHATLALLLAGIGFLRPQVREAPLLQVSALPPPPEVVEVPPPPPDVPVDPEILDPLLTEIDVIADPASETLEAVGDPDFTSASPFEASDWSNVIGPGGGSGGPLGSRGSGNPRGRRPSPTEAAVARGLEWLADHQTPDDGYWDADEFMSWDQDARAPASDGAGSPVHDVGATGLACLAFLGHGNTLTSGAYSEVLRRGVGWLRRAQLASGLLGEEVGSGTLYNHAIGTMALGEAYYAGHSPLLRDNLKGAVQVIQRARNPYNAWRYSLEPNGDNDSSITGWMVFALKTAKESGIDVSQDAFDGAENWFATMTDKGTGRTGYAFGEGGGPGGRPSRPRAYLERFPSERSEALTAVALLSRIFLSDSDKLRSWRDHPDYEVLRRQADLCARTLPVWDPEGGSCDFYYWYYGTFALYQWGGEHWTSWRKAIETALLPNQRSDGNFAGSWDPVGPWGHEGGRVYSTAVGTLILEVYYRYSRVLGGR